MPTKKRLGGQIKVKSQPLDASGLGYQRYKEIEATKSKQAKDEKMERVLDAILRNENITRPTQQQKLEAKKKLFDDASQQIVDKQREQLMNVANNMMTQMNAPKPRKPTVPRTTIKSKVALNTPSTSMFTSEPLPSALLPPTTTPDGIVKSAEKKIEKKNKVMLKADSIIYPNVYAPQLSATKQKQIMLSPSTPASMKQVVSSTKVPAKTTLDLRGYF